LPGTTADLAAGTVTFPTGLTIESSVLYDFGGGTLEDEEVNLPEVQPVYDRAAAACRRDGIDITNVFYANSASPAETADS
jgi:hypothetical protein